MSNADWALLQALTDQSFANGAFRQNLRPAFNAVGATGQDAAAFAELALAYAEAAAASYALALALTGGGQGVGTEALKLPRTINLGSAAFLDWDAAAGIFTTTRNAAYQVTAHDLGRLLLATSGTHTWTLPLAADLPDGWWCLLRNRAGANLTIARSGADTINAGASSVAIATGTAIQRAIRTSPTTFEVA